MINLNYQYIINKYLIGLRMKKLLLLFITLLVFSCDNSTDNSTADIGLIGQVMFRTQRTADNGQKIGKYFNNDGTAGIKVELISGDEVVATTTTKESDTIDCMFVFNDVQTDVEYRIKASIADDIYKETEPFTISDSDIFEEDKESFYSKFSIVPEWFEKGAYYLRMMEYNHSNLVFDLYENDINFLIYPQPVNQYTNVVFEVPETNTCVLEITTILMEPVKVIANEILEKGFHQISVDASDISDGIYILRLTIDDEKYYYSFRKYSL